MSLKVGYWLSQHMCMGHCHCSLHKAESPPKALGYQARLFQESFALRQSLRMSLRTEELKQDRPQNRKQHALRSDRVSILL